MKSGYRYKYKGVNIERLICNLSCHFKLFDVKKNGVFGEFCLPLFCDKKFEKMIKNFDIEIVDKQGFGLLYKFFCFVQRFGIVAAIITAVVFFAVSSNFVFGVKISGNNNISSEQILQVLNQNGFKQINLKNDINCKQFEKTLMTSFDDISLVSIIVKGNTLVVSVKEKVQNDEYENLDSFKPLTSDFDGVLTKVVLVSGTLNKKVGDIIKKGDVLVFPYIVDSAGNQRNVKPQAEIFAKVYVTQTESFYDVETVNVRTGEKLEKKEIFAFGIKIFENFVQCDFDSYQTEVVQKSISQNNLIPITIKQTFFYETKSQIIQNDFEQKKQQILDDLKQKVLENLKEYDIIENEIQNISSIAGKNDIEYIFEIQKRII